MIDDCRLRFETADCGLKVPMGLGPPSTIVNSSKSAIVGSDYFKSTVQICPDDSVIGSTMLERVIDS